MNKNESTNVKHHTHNKHSKYKKKSKTEKRTKTTQERTANENQRQKKQKNSPRFRGPWQSWHCPPEPRLGTTFGGQAGGVRSAPRTAAGKQHHSTKPQKTKTTQEQHNILPLPKNKNKHTSKHNKSLLPATYRPTVLPSKIPTQGTLRSKGSMKVFKIGI